MERFTKIENGVYSLDASVIRMENGAYTGPAVERLALYEALHESLLVEQERIAAKLEPLRAAGKTNSYQFKELMGKKLMNAHTLSLLQAHGIV